ncbi:hypothetical protein EVAR_97485_1 [Eumeta japonica]|uniref:Uncharacterized protein n=1 Tax=Eumeta variegata TaxID=151549 RepID=A0A4C1Z5X8_EUMVA|nr:hypothetical protein EVAR_97485_1 [Eumeta japonica]
MRPFNNLSTSNRKSFELELSMLVQYKFEQANNRRHQCSDSIRFLKLNMQVGYDFISAHLGTRWSTHLWTGLGGKVLDQSATTMLYSNKSNLYDVVLFAAAV